MFKEIEQNRGKILEEIFRAENILKVYPNGVVANKDVNLSLSSNEIHALIGENGAGKSTLMKIIFGMEQPSEGKLYLYGKEIHIDNPRWAIEHGIGMVHQHFMLVPSLTIAENIVLGNEPLRSGLFIDQEQMLATAQEYNEKYGFGIDVNKRIQDVSVGVKQKTEILKALVRGAKILILDEPTAVLTPQETRDLFKQLRSLKDDGHTIVFISHKLDEIMELCDRVTIMRHGKTINTINIVDTDVGDISRQMVGRDVVLKIPKTQATKGEEVLKLKNVSYWSPIGKKELDNVSFGLRGGEILGVAGVEGNGQSQLADVILGLLEKNKGHIFYHGKELDEITPKKVRDLGLSFISEDRLHDGLASELSVLDNLFPNRIDDFTKGSFLLDYKKMENLAHERVKEFEILTDSVYRQVKMLSGGNMQKVVGAREIIPETKIIIANQPTRGIDAGAAELMRRKLLRLRELGAGILLISSDLNEILELSDSLIVMYNGKVNAYFENTDSLTEELLGYYMLGVKSQSSQDKERIGATNESIE